ncbi:MAG TPA: glycerol-3-phosphate responsive antiterminator [Terracidiphilus sp.]|nr:glycerol-3-phosphate responsive antiterminator [Terracidiphilus sp.]
MTVATEGNGGRGKTVQESSKQPSSRQESSKSELKLESSRALRALCQQTLIIPAVRKVEHVDQAIAANGKIVYLLTGDLENSESMIRKILSADKLPIVNLDLLNGFSRDRYAVNYLKRAGARGIISTHFDPLRHALSIGLYAVQRTFLLDSGAMDTITNQLRNSQVDALEVLPAQVAPKMLDRVRSLALDLPIVGGGLIQTMKEVEDLLAAGLSAISTSNPQMWIR